MATEICKFFNIEIEIDGKKTQQLLVSNNTLLENIRNKIGENIELIYQGNILDDGTTICDIGINENDSVIYAFYTVDTVDNKTHDLIDIFQNILETYTQPNGLPLGHYHNIFNSIMNIHSSNNRNTVSNSDANTNNNTNNNINAYDVELDTLRNLGFDNDNENLLLLQLYNGNVNYVANLLLEH